MAARVSRHGQAGGFYPEFRARMVQRAIARRHDFGVPASLDDSVQQFPEDELSAPEIAELIDKQNSHRLTSASRIAVASTQKYTGKTRQ